MEETQRIYLPAAGYSWLLPLYDPLTRLMGVEKAHEHLISQANLRWDHHVLEIGCGTGNLAIVAKRHCPRAKIVGLDPDSKALARARRKAKANELDIRFDYGFANALWYPDGSFDRVLSAFMFHHLLTVGDKIKTFSEARRVLSPGGSLHLVDFEGAADDSDGFVTRVLHHSDRLRDNTGKRIIELMKKAGFNDAEEISHQSLGIFGRVTYYRAYSPYRPH